MALARVTPRLSEQQEGKQQRNSGKQPFAHSELLSEVQRASTLLPTELIAAIAATTIKPAINAYSRNRKGGHSSIPRIQE